MEPLPTFLNLPAEKKDRIFRAALNEFGDKGFKGASLNTMIKELGIAKGSLYQYFKDKDALFLYVFTRAIDMVIDNLRSVRDNSLSHPFSERLSMILHEGVRFIEHNPEVYTLYVTLLIDRTIPSREDLIKIIRTQGLEYIGDFLSQAKENGELRPDIDLAVAGLVIDAVLDRFFLSRTIPLIAPGMGIFGGDKNTMARWIDGIVSVLCQGVVHG